jgi:hypothetical protein
LAPVACSLVVSSELDSKDRTISSTDAGEATDAKDASPPDAGDAGDGSADTATIQDAPPGVPDASVDAPIGVVDEPEASIPVFCNASDPDLAACYQFDLPENLGLDESQYGNHASTSDVSTMAGKSGTALVHGPTSVVKIADSPSLDVLAITIEAWLRPTELPATRFGVFDNDLQYGVFLQSTGQIRCSAASHVLTSTPTIPINAWTHVAYAYDGSTLGIYIDGKRTDEMAATGEMSTSSTVGSRIGANSPSGDAFIGAIDQLRVWRRARSAQEICEAAGACPAVR